MTRAEIIDAQHEQHDKRVEAKDLPSATDVDTTLIQHQPAA
jgi:hypothetical protein